MISTFSLPCRLQDLGRRHHDAEVDDLVIVAGEHDADDVLADVVDIALDRRHQDLAGSLALAIVDAVGGVRQFLGLHMRQQPGHRLLHDARRLHHLRQEHLSGAEQVADDIHAGHQRAFDDMQRALGGKPRLVGVGVDEFGDAVDQRVGNALLDRPVAPGEVAFPCFLAGRALEAFGDLQHALGGRAAALRRAVEDDILAGLAQFRIDRCRRRRAGRH